MSLQIAAQHLASKGRGPDTMLVHMAPGEVKSLQALARAHGGTLTTNPDTGLPEAGFLSAILPLVAGAALGPAGLALMSAPMAGLAVGAATGLATGSLKRGLMAGLGAYGGAGLMGSVMGAGTGAISAGAPGAAGTLTGADFAGQAATLSGEAAAALNPTTALAPTGAVVPPAYTPGVLGSGAFDPTGGGVLNVGGGAANPLQYADVAAPMAPNVTPMPVAAPTVAAPTFPGTLTGAEMQGQATALSNEVAQQRAVTEALAKATPFETFKAGLGAIADKPSLLLNKANLGYGLAAAAPVASYMMEPPKAPVYQGSGPNPYAYSYDPGTQSYSPLPSSSAERRYFDPRYQRLAEGGMARGGISHLGDYSDGGRLLRGPGDGVSDSIPATIANKRPARLADGEFVVPARIVSELGNGSTEAGARKLYAMMNRVQQRRAKTMGKGKVAVNSRADKLLPA